MALDTSRSTALSWEFPPPRWAQGLSTGATNCEWKRQWRQLHRWTTAEIARQLSEYWESVPQHDKDALVTWNSTLLSRFYSLNGSPPLRGGTRGQGVFRWRDRSHPPGCCFQSSRSAFARRSSLGLSSLASKCCLRRIRLPSCESAIPEGEGSM